MGSAVLLLKNTFFCVLNRFTPTAYPFVRYAFKAEFNNPSSSIQDRVAFSALEEGFRSQILRKDDTIVCKGLSKEESFFPSVILTLWITYSPDSSRKLSVFL